MSSREVKKVSPQDLQLVQNLIERCLQLYMSRKEVVSTLLDQAQLEPRFTELVLQKLEEENQDFFKDYHLRLILKDQIMKFNKLLKTQAELMCKISPAAAAAGAASIPIPNGSHDPLLHQNSACYPPDNTGQVMKLENMHQSIDNLPNGLSNGGLSVHPCMQSGAGMSGLSRRDDVLLMAQNSNMGLIQGMNGEGMIKSESGYAAEQPSFMYNLANNVHPAIAEVHIPSFIGEESNPKPVNQPIVDPDISSFGFLGQIPGNFSLSDLTADFNISSDILFNYSWSPYLAPDTDFLNPHGNELDIPPM